MLLDFVHNLVCFDRLAIMMSSLIVFIILTVSTFAFRYMKGDALYRRSFALMGLLGAFLLLMVSADNMILFVLAWGICNVLLVILMVHKSSWQAARASGLIAAKTYGIGFCCVSIGLFLIYYMTGEVSIHRIVNYNFYNVDSPVFVAALLFLLIGAMTQSAIWPFHKWLISSLNSPMHVSAVMHAGLVGGGGFLLIRFAPLYVHTPYILAIIFIIGLVTAFIGTLFKLVQSDIKRMLACSTMAQVGFMIAQIGLGLFSAAFVHLCYHGLFKAYLFLASSSAAQEEKYDTTGRPTALSFFCGIMCGVLGSYSFLQSISSEWFEYNTSLFTVFVVCIALSQFSFSALIKNPLSRTPFVAIAVMIVGWVYGLSVHSVELFVAPMNLFHPQQINFLYVFGMILLLVSWLVMIFFIYFNKVKFLPDWIIKIYVQLINASQPHSSTITTHRNDYKY